MTKPAEPAFAAALERLSQLSVTELMMLRDTQRVLLSIPGVSPGQLGGVKIEHMKTILDALRSYREGVGNADAWATFEELRTHMNAVEYRSVIATLV